jgi:hypothetical protein
MLGRIPGLTLRFSASDVDVQISPIPKSFHIHFEGATGHARLEGRDRMASETNYLIGSNSAEWRTHVANYGRVRYSSLYPGIDVVFYGNADRLEHDFIVSPGADYHRIQMRLPSRAHASVGTNGDLVIHLLDGQVRMRRPTIYQDGNAGREHVAGRFRVRHDGEIGFIVERYDKSRPLVIDPILTFSTYLASTFSETNYVATDSAGATYVTGVGELGYPVTPGAFAGCSACAANQIVTYISKYSADGKTLLYSTLLGGSSYTQSFGIGVDRNGNAVVAGYTQSTDFPTKNGRSIGTNLNTNFGFVTSLSADGSSLNYSTLLGGSTGQGSTSTQALALATDAAGDAYVSGSTDSGAFPLTPGALHEATPGYPEDTVFLSKFTPAGTLVYSGIVGDATPQNGGGGPIGVSKVALDSSGSVYLTGQAGTLWPVTSGAYQQQIAGSAPYDAPFVTKVSPDGASLDYSTFFGSAYQVNGIAVLANGNVWLTGWGTVPITPDAFQSTPSGGTYLSELDATGSHLLYSTYFGGSQAISQTTPHGLAIDADGDIWLVGQTGDPQLPLVKPLQSTMPIASIPTSTSFIAQFDSTGKTLKFSSFLGGTAGGAALGIAVDATHRAHVSGFAEPGFYTTPGVYLGQVPPAPASVDTVYGYAALIDPAVAASALCVANPLNQGLYWPDTAAGTTSDAVLKLMSCGDLPLTIHSVEAANGAFSVPADLDQCPQSLVVGESCTVAVRFAPTERNTYNSTLTIETDAPVTEAVLPLHGNGVIPQLSAYNPVFVLTLVGQSSAPVNVFLQNMGGAPATLDYSKTMISGNFAIASQACGPVIPPGSACVLPIVFSPQAAGTRTGTLQIVSNDPVNPVLAVPLVGTGYTASPPPEITEVNSPTIARGSTGVTLIVGGFGFFPNSVVQLNGKTQKTTYNGPGQLSAALDASAIPASGYGELPVTVYTPAPGGGTSNPYNLTIYDRIFTQNAGLIYEPIGKKIYVSVPASATANANTILPINPATATIGTPIAVGNDPGALAVSGDGKYLYVVLNAAHEIQRIQLANGVVERTFALPVDPTFGQSRVVNMQAVPGVPTSVVATLAIAASPSEGGVALFNDSGLVTFIPAIAQQYGSPSVSLDTFTFNGADGSRVYGLPFDAGNFFTMVTVDSSGLHYTRPSGPVNTAPATPGSLVACDATLLYTNTGEVWDPQSRKLLHTYNLGSALLAAVVPDTTLGRTYFMDSSAQYAQYSALAIRGFDQSTLSETARLSFMQEPESFFPIFSTDLVRWGTNGFAFRFNDNSALDPSRNSVVLVTSSITNAGNLNPTPNALTLAPASLAFGAADFTLTVTGTGFVSGSTVDWDGTPRITTFVSATKLTAQIYASDIAEPGTEQVLVVSPGPGGGMSAPVSFTVSGTDLTPGPLLLTPSALTFASQTVATQSAAEAITLQNSSQVDVTGVAISLTGADASSFTETNTCIATLAAGASCQVNVVFAPPSAGTATASISVASSAADSPQMVTLNGIATAAAPFTVSPPPNGSGSTTVAAGQTASYSMMLAPAAGYSGKLSLTCGNLPAHAACTFTPPSLSVSNGSAVNFTVAVSTADTQSAALPRLFPEAVPVLGLCLLPFWRRRRGSRSGTLLLLAVVLLSGIMAGCGGGSNSTPTATPPSTAKVAPGTYTVQIIATDGVTTAKTPLSLIVQ